MNKIVALILIGIILGIYSTLIFRIHRTCKKIKKDCDKIIKSLGDKYVDDVQQRRW